MAKKSLSELSKRGFLACAISLAFGSSCATYTNVANNIPKEVNVIRYKVEEIVEKSLRESVGEHNNLRPGLESELEDSIGNKIDSSEYGIHFEDYSWPRTDIPGIESLDFHTDRYKANVSIGDEKVSLGIILPTIIVKDGKTYMFNEYKSEVSLKNR